MSARTRTKQNLLACGECQRRALDRGLITLECEPVARSIFEFNIGAYPAIAFVAEGGVNTVAIHAIAKPTELGRQMVGRRRSSSGNVLVKRRRSPGWSGAAASTCNQA